MNDGFDVRTMDGQTVRIIDKESHPQRGDVLVAEDGSKYVLDYATGNVLSFEDAPLAENEGEPVTEKKADGSNQQEQTPETEETPDKDDAPAEDEPTEEEDEEA